MSKSLFGKNFPAFYVIFRVVVGFLFLSHGLQKLFPVFGGPKVTALASLFGVAGIIECIGGVLLILGLYTRMAAFFSGINMIGAWFIVHVKNGWVPILNGGELALLYLVCFLIIISKGSGVYSLDNSFKNKE
mgnify:FL=1